MPLFHGVIESLDLLQIATEGGEGPTTFSVELPSDAKESMNETTLATRRDAWTSALWKSPTRSRTRSRTPSRSSLLLISSLWRRPPTALIKTLRTSWCSNGNRHDGPLASRIKSDSVRLRPEPVPLISSIGVVSGPGRETAAVREGAGGRAEEFPDALSGGDLRGRPSLLVEPLVEVPAAYVRRSCERQRALVFRFRIGAC